jgi:predicted component of type VI protein secretion system
MVEDASVSRRHARVLREGELWLVEDLGSSNGTFLNGVRGQRLTLRAGDLVTFGTVAFDVLAVEGASVPAISAASGSASAAAPPPAAVSRDEAAAAAKAERERAQLTGSLRRPQRSRGFGDLSQQSMGMKFLALLLGLVVLAGVAFGVRLVAGLF